MDSLFPFGFPFPTAFYLTIYLLTLMIHIVFMNYVLAGSAYLAVHTVLRGHSRAETPIAALLRDWMPFMLSAAITAGIAPLLFLQILYKQQFYTANLLLFYRWMAILPVLIAGFYLAYLLKSKRVGHWPLPARATVGCGLFACFAFIGWSWVENHLLSVRPEVWSQQYASGALIFRSPELLPRLALWFIAAFPTLALVIGWQLWYRHHRENMETVGADPGGDATATRLPGSRRTSKIALAGLVLSTLSAAIYFSMMSQTARDAILGVVALPYLILSISGAIVQAVAWLIQYRQAILSSRWMCVASFGLVVNFVGTAVVNEATRLAALDISVLYEKHERAFQIGGQLTFLLFFILNFTLMGFCVRLVRRGART